MYGNGVGSYRQTEVLTADPKKLVIMCYEGAIDNLKIAKEKSMAGEYEAKTRAVHKAEDIISELMHTLDFEKGGEIATNLDSLYNYMTRRILHAEANRLTEPFDEVVGMLEELKGAWEEIFSSKKKEFSKMTAPVTQVQTESPDQALGAAAYGPRVRL